MMSVMPSLRMSISNLRLDVRVLYNWHVAVTGCYLAKLKRQAFNASSDIRLKLTLYSCRSETTLWPTKKRLRSDRRASVGRSEKPKSVPMRRKD
jgi:hypothetical protein